MTVPSDNSHLCGATAVFWADQEACEAECDRAAGHIPSDVHWDEILGEWSEDDLPTQRAVNPLVVDVRCPERYPSG